MSIITDGKLITNELCANSRGGTELMIDRMLKHIPQELLQGYEIIHSRIPDELSKNHKTILVCHDLANDPMYSKLTNPDFVEQIHKFVFVSNWQMQYFNMSMGIPYSKSIVINNAVEEFAPRAASNPDIIKIIYHTTPHRGLALLLPVFNAIAKNIKNIELDIYSSFNIYGWPERDKDYKKLFDLAEKSERVNYHGFKDNKTVRKALTESHIFAYPSIWPETSCLAAIEAMCAGNAVVHPNYAALPETCSFFGNSYQWNEDPNAHAREFMHHLVETIMYIDNNGLHSEKQMEVFNEHYGITNMVRSWTNLLK